MQANQYLQEDFPTELWLPFIWQQPTKIFSQGELIYLQGDQALSFYYLKEGRVKSYMQSEDGNERVLHTYQEGTIFGEVSFFDELPRVSSGLALSRCKVVSIDRKMVEQQFTMEPRLALSMIKYLARTVHMLSDQVDEMAFRSVPQRVARYLVQHKSDQNEVTVTQEEIATSVSASRITVSRVLSKFTDDGWIETQYGNILLKNVSDLEHFLENRRRI